MKTLLGVVLCSPTCLAFVIGLGPSTCRVAHAQSLRPDFTTDSGSYLRARMLHAEPLVRSFADEARPRKTDPWLGFDKVQHATFGFLFTLGGQYVFVNKAGLTEHEALPLSIGVAATAGLAKEIRDRRRGSGVFSKRDLAADLVGILLATTLILL